jgi:S1-C subfamily serine protease
MDTAGSGGFQFQSSSTYGYAIPVNQALSAAKQIKAGSASSTVHIGPTALLGVVVESSGSSGLGSSGFGGFGSGGFGSGNGSGSSSSTSGAYITDVVTGGPAAQAGLVAGDTITSVDNRSVTSADSLTSVMMLEKPGAAVPVQYLDTSGRQQSTTIKLGTGPPQ